MQGKKSREFVGSLLAALIAIMTGVEARAHVSTEQPLVQILIYGLGAFEFSTDTAGNPKVLVHLPEGGSHPHEIEFHKGILDSGNRRWDSLNFDLGGHLVRFPDLETPGEQLMVHDPGPATTPLPLDSDDATGVKWLARYGQLDSGPLQIDRTGADVHIELTNGQLETCGLVHPPNHDFRVCEMRALGGSGCCFQRAMSEYMVLRYALPAGTTSFDIEIQDLVNGSKTPRTVGVITPGPKIEWKGKQYKHFFDVLIANLPPNTAQRAMKSPHANQLRGQHKLFPDAKIDWTVTAADCSGSGSVWTCRPESEGGCVSGLQPTCWDYFQDYKDFPSGLDRTVCPFVGYP